MSIEPIDYLMENDFILRFKFDPFSTPEVGYKENDRARTAWKEGRLISVTDEGMVMVGWRSVNITHRGITPTPIAAPEGSVFLDA